MHDVDKPFDFNFINNRIISLSQRRVSNQKVLILARIAIEIAKNNHFLVSLNKWRCLVENPIRFPVFAGPEMDDKEMNSMCLAVKVTMVEPFDSELNNLNWLTGCQSNRKAPFLQNSGMIVSPFCSHFLKLCLGVPIQFLQCNNIRCLLLDPFGTLLNRFLMIEPI